MLGRPLVKAELKKHARRAARIQRVHFLAEANGKPKVAEDAKALTSAPASNDSLITEADFEEEADAQIDAPNMEAELALLASEIAADK